MYSFRSSVVLLFRCRSCTRILLLALDPCKYQYPTTLTQDTRSEFVMLWEVLADSREQGTRCFRSGISRPSGLSPSQPHRLRSSVSVISRGPLLCYALGVSSSSKVLPKTLGILSHGGRKLPFPIAPPRLGVEIGLPRRPHDLEDALATHQTLDRTHALAESRLKSMTGSMQRQIQREISTPWSGSSGKDISPSREGNPFVSLRGIFGPGEWLLAPSPRRLSQHLA